MKPKPSFRKVIKEELASKTAKDLMKKKFDKIDVDTPIRKVVSIFDKKNLHVLTVFDGKTFVGEIFKVDLLKLVVNVDKVPQKEILEMGFHMDYGYFAKTAKDVVTEHKVTVYEDDLIEDIAQIMLKNEIYSCVVLDKKDNIVGVITETEILAEIMKQGK